MEYGHHLRPADTWFRLLGGDHRLVLEAGAELENQQHAGHRVCVDCLEEALQRYGNPEIFNTDQGCQFTSESFTGVLKARGIAISMDGRGRALDNIFVERLWRSVKNEDVYLKGYTNAMELMLGLTEYFVFYNDERPHQSLGNLTPDEVYATASGGGARTVDKFRRNEAASCSCEKDGQTSLN